MEPARNATAHRVRGISPVWLVPLAALVVATWLGLRSWHDRGVEVVINFDSAPGIVVNKTELRYKDVRVGVVRGVRLTDDLSRVRVIAEVIPEIAERLSQHSHFWVVSPQISAGGISGLSTLISGVYIGLDPGEPGAAQAQYEGSLIPVSVDSEAQGKRFRLRADNLGSLNIGSPIYFREVPAGEVLGYQLAADGGSVTIDAFVRAPYDRYVHRQSRFWNVSGFGVEVSDRGVKARVSSLTSLVAGGIAFDTPEDLRNPIAAADNQQFLLYPDKQAVNDGIYTVRYYYQLRFSGSVRGLNVGAAVEFRGIPVGEVVSIRFAPTDQDELLINVLVAFEPQRLHGTADLDPAAMPERLEELVKKGLKAQLKVGSLITGAIFVDLIFEPEQPGEVVRAEGSYPLLPTAEAPYEQISRQLADLLRKANSFPIEQLGEDLNASIGSLRRILGELEQQGFADKLDNTVGNLESGSGQLAATLEQAGRTLGQLEATLKTFDDSVAPDSPLVYELQRMAREVTEASASFRRLSQQLQREPNALIFGKEEFQP